jgi:hypothetical protein
MMMNKLTSAVIASEARQSMTSGCMDCRASLAVTEMLFKVSVRYRAGYGRLAMAAISAQGQLS